MSQQPFSREQAPPDCYHPIYQLQAPIQEAGPGTVPRTVLHCGGCSQTWSGGHALAVVLKSSQDKLRELERLVRAAPPKKL